MTQSKKNYRRLISTDDAASYLGISPRTRRPLACEGAAHAWGLPMSPAIDRVLVALERAGCQTKRRGERRWAARCPAHDDRNPSLTLSRGRRCILVRCHAGCPTTEVLAALGLEWSDLFDAPRPKRWVR